MKKNKSNLAFWFWLAVIIFAAVGIVRHFHIKNFQTIKQDILYTSGQPRGMDYTRLLYKYHIATIINIRSADEHRDQNWHNEEITWIKNNGVKYIELPVVKHSPAAGIPDTNTIERFLNIMSENTNLPVLVHDSGGRKRVAYLAAAWMLKLGNFTLEQTIDKIQKINDRPLDEQETNFLKSQANFVK